MGRLLDIAQAVPLVETAPAEQAVKQKIQLDHAAYRTEGEAGYAVSAISAVTPPVDYSKPVSDVLDLLTQAAGPLLHSAILRELMGLGWAKEKARAAIAECQGRGLISHNLVSGYILSAHGPETDGDDREEKS